MARVALVFPFSTEPRSLGTYQAVQQGINSCSAWIKQNLITSLLEHYEWYNVTVDLFVYANFENYQQAQLIKKQIENLYKIKDYVLVDYNDLLQQIDIPESARRSVYLKQVLQPLTLRNILKHIKEQHGEYDYYLKTRFDIFPSSQFNYANMLKTVEQFPDWTSAYGYTKESFALCCDLQTTGSFIAPLYMDDIQIFFSNQASVNLIDNFEDWLEYTREYISRFDWNTHGSKREQTQDGELCFIWPEINYGNLFYYSRVRLLVDIGLRSVLYRLNTFQKRHELSNIIADPKNEKNWHKLADIQQGDYIDGKRLIELQGGDANDGFRNKIHSS